MTQFFNRYNTASIALSGGADSACVLLLACEYLGSENITAYTCINNHIFTYEIEIAQQICASLGVQHVLFKTEMDERFYSCKDTRCYHCKSAIIKKITELSESDVIFDGTNADDKPDERPGFRALKESTVVSPLLELGLGKAFAVTKAAELGIDFHDESCKASRLNTVNEENLYLVETAEDALRHRYRGIRYRADENRIMFKKPTLLFEDDYLFILETVKNPF